MLIILKYIFFQLTLAILCKKSIINCKLHDAANKRKTTSKIYLSEMLRKFEGNSTGHNNFSLFAPHPNDLGASGSFYKPSSAYHHHTSRTSPSYCRPMYRKFTLKLGKNCQNIEYTLVECNGYCHSQSMIWKNHEEIKVVSCCTISRVLQKLTKVYCLKQIEPEQIKNEFYQKMKDLEVFQIFQNSFTKSAWTDQIGYKGKQFYGGYYSVLVSYNATCECEYV